MLLCCAGKVLDVQSAIGICGDASDAAFPLNHHGLVVGADVAYALAGRIMDFLDNNHSFQMDSYKNKT